MQAEVLRYVPLLALALLVFCPAGCDRIKEITDQAEEKAKPITQPVQEHFVEPAKEALNLVGSMELQLDVPVTTPACHATLLVLPSQTGNVLQLASYKEPSFEKFPSVFLRAEVGRTASLADLEGETIQAELYVKSSAQEPTWHVATGAPVEVTIGKVADGQLTAEVTGELIRRGGRETTPVTGTFTAIYE